MRKLLLITILFLIAKLSTGQVTQNRPTGMIYQGVGSTSTWYQMGGVTYPVVGLVLPEYTDTTAASAATFTKLIAGVMIRVSNKIYYRNAALSSWIEIINGSSFPGWGLDGNATTSGKFLGTTDAQPLAIYTNNSERMRILSGGNVGIGDATPASLLTVKTNAIGTTQLDAYGLLLSNQTAAAAGAQQISPPLVWSGRGWKTSAGGASIDVRWKAEILPIQGVLSPTVNWKLFSTTDAGVTYNERLSLTSGGNLFIWSDVSTLAIGTINSLKLGSVGTTNYFFGTQPPVASTGTLNVALGQNSLQSLTSASNNTAIGHSALGAVTSGGINTAVGYQSLRDQTTGISNVAVGVNSLLVSTTGFQNTSIGAGSMEALTVGQENTGIGYDAGLNATTAIRNVWLGWNAKTSTDGMENVAAGYLAGSSTTAGNTDNVFIGAFAGNNASQLGDADNTVAIGANSFTTVDNSVAIGNNSMTQFDFWGALRPNGSAGTSGQFLTSQGIGTAPIWTTASSGGSPAGNFGNLQIGRNGAFATPASDSLDFESATGLTVKGDINNTGVWKTSSYQMMRYPNQVSFEGTTIYGNGGNGLTHASGSEGQYNLFVGYNTGLNCATCSLNNLVGTQAGYSLTTGDKNTAMGHNAMLFATSATYNSAYGFSSMTACTTCFFNTSTGSSGMLNITTGTYNAGHGVNNFHELTTGTENAAYGLDALYNITTGGHNTALGAKAGRNFTAAASNNISIGYKTMAVPYNSSNTGNIGNLVFMTALDGVDSSLSSGNVGIGIVTPVAKFQVFNAGVQMRLSYDASNYTEFNGLASGILRISSSNGGLQLFTSGVGNSVTIFNSTGDNGISIDGPGRTIGSISGSSALALTANAAESVIIGAGVGSISASAKLQLNSTTQGFLPPRMTTTQKNAISSPAEGLIVYDTTLHKLCVFTGTVWETVTSL